MLDQGMRSSVPPQQRESLAHEPLETLQQLPAALDLDALHHCQKLSMSFNVVNGLQIVGSLDWGPVLAI